MNRGITNDYIIFVLNRWGDINGPGNSLGHILTTPFTVTNFSYPAFSFGGLVPAVVGSDYTALAQNTNASVPINGIPGPGVDSASGVNAINIMHRQSSQARQCPGYGKTKPTNAVVSLTLTNAVNHDERNQYGEVTPTLFFRPRTSSQRMRSALRSGALNSTTQSAER